MRSLDKLLLTLLATTAYATQPAAAAWGNGRDQNVILPPAPVLEAPIGKSLRFDRVQDKEFTLRHIYHRGSHRFPKLHRKVDIHADTILLQSDGDNTESTSVGPFPASSRPMRVQRMADRSEEQIRGILAHADMFGTAVSLPASAWSEDEIEGPNITDPKTVLTFAHMAANAYVLEPGNVDWEDVKGGFNYTEDFGWTEDGLRGHIFADPLNSTVVIGLKGTSMAVFDGADTTGNDKLNDNLFGSCCCGQGGQFFWKQVCDCQTSTYTCNNTCLLKSLREKSHYYHAAMDLYYNVTERYPEAEIWLTGHSLGGVVSALLGLTFGLPTLTFETFPDALAAGRLGLPTPPGYRIGSHQSRVQTGVYHFGHTADPVYMGACGSASASCTLGGYAFQSQCHTGATCTYDTVKDFGWRVGIGNHRMAVVLKDVIEKYDKVPACEEDVECVDCFNWKFYESNSSAPITSSASTSTKTKSRTATCLTPGWWGCLDETTTVRVTQTSTTTITTCLTPGWFGCKDGSTTYTETTTITTQTDVRVTTTSTSSSSTSSSTSELQTTCKTPGWFGCNDVTTTSASTAKPKPSSIKTTMSPTSTVDACTSKDWFGFVCVDPSPDPNDSVTSMATPAPTPKQGLR